MYHSCIKCFLVIQHVGKLLKQERVEYLLFINRGHQRLFIEH